MIKTIAKNTNMTNTLYFNYNGDAYELELHDGDLYLIWRYPKNKPGHPEIIVYGDIDDEQLRDKIDSKVIRGQV